MEVLVLAKARDGSTSLRSVFEAFYLLNRERPDWGYVSNTYDLWPAIKDYIRGGYSAALYDIFLSWSQRIEISHGLAFVLPVVRSVFGGNLRIIHVQRDRSAHVRSLCKRVDIDPQHWIGYSPGYDIDVYDDADFVPRPTAVDYEEMSNNEWLNLSVEEKFGWFIDKQSELTHGSLTVSSIAAFNSKSFVVGCGTGLPTGGICNVNKNKPFSSFGRDFISVNFERKK